MRPWIAVLGLFACATVCAAAEPKLVDRMSVPAKFRNMSARGRYTEAYESFWWNCVMVRAGDLKARCPSLCSGSPAATSGCLDGGTNASQQIDRLLEKHSDREVQSYLRSLVADPDVLRRFSEGRFHGHPKAEALP
jgi:hypothetical protein